MALYDKDEDHYYLQVNGGFFGRITESVEIGHLEVKVVSTLIILRHSQPVFVTMWTDLLKF